MVENVAALASNVWVELGLQREAYDEKEEGEENLKVGILGARRNCRNNELADHDDDFPRNDKLTTLVAVPCEKKTVAGADEGRRRRSVSEQRDRTRQ